MSILKGRIFLFFAVLLSSSAYATEHESISVNNYLSTALYTGKLLGKGLSIQTNQILAIKKPEGCYIINYYIFADDTQLLSNTDEAMKVSAHKTIVQLLPYGKQITFQKNIFLTYTCRKSIKATVMQSMDMDTSIY